MVGLYNLIEVCVTVCAKVRGTVLNIKPTQYDWKDLSSLFFYIP